MKLKALLVLGLMMGSLFMLVSLPESVFASGSKVQDTSCTVDAASCAFTNNAGANNLIEVSVSSSNCDATTTAPTVSAAWTGGFTTYSGTDMSQANTLDCISTYHIRAFIFLALVTGTGKTVSISGGTGAWVWRITEWSGVSNTNDVSSPGASSTAGTSLTVTSYTPSSGDFVMAAYSACTSGSQTFTAGTGYTLLGSQGGTQTGTCSSASPSFALGTEYREASGSADTSPITDSISARWSGISVAMRETGTQNVKCTMDNGGTPQATKTLSGGSPAPSPNTVLCDGSAHAITLVIGTTITATEPADGNKSRYRFAGGGTTFTWTSSASEEDFTNYLEVAEYYCATPIDDNTNVWDGAFVVRFTGTQAGTGGTRLGIATTVNAKGIACSSVMLFSDYGRAVTTNATLPDGANQNWNSQGLTFSPTTPGGTFSQNYFRQLTKTMKIVATLPIIFDAGRTIKITGPVNGIKSILATFTPSLGDAFKTATIVFDYNNFIDCEPSSGGLALTVWVANTTQTVVLTSPGGSVTCGYSLITGTTSTSTITATTTATTTSPGANVSDPPNLDWFPWAIIGLIAVVAYLARKKLK